MTDQEKISALQEAVKVAMSHWAGWVDKSRGMHPTELGGRELQDWNRCEALAYSWTPQAPGGIGG